MKLEIIVHLTIWLSPHRIPDPRFVRCQGAQPTKKSFTSWSQSEPISSALSGTNSRSAVREVRVTRVAPAWAAVVAATAATPIPTAAAATELPPAAATATAAAPAAAAAATARAAGLNLDAGLGLLNRGGGGDAAGGQINTKRRGEGAYPTMRAMTIFLNCILKRVWVFV
jgi:hypothetical protein